MLLLNSNYCPNKANISKKNLVVASLIGGCYSLISLLPKLSFETILISKLIVCFLMSRIAFGQKNLLKNYYCFLIINFVFAGLMMTLWFFASPPAMNVSNGIAYFCISTKTLIFSILLAYIIINIFSLATKKETIIIQDYWVEIHVNNQSVLLKGFVDTGNLIYDIFSSTPVVVCKFDSIKSILPEQLQQIIKTKNLNINNLDINQSNKFSPKDYKKHHIRFVPFRTVNHQELLTCFRPEKFRLKKIISNQNIYTQNISDIDTAIYTDIHDVFVGVVLDNNLIDKNYDIILNPGLITKK